MGSTKPPPHTPWPGEHLPWKQMHYADPSPSTLSFTWSLFLRMAPPPSVRPSWDSSWPQLRPQLLRHALLSVPAHPCGSRFHSFSSNSCSPLPSHLPTVSPMPVDSFTTATVMLLKHRSHHIAPCLRRFDGCALRKANCCHS